MALSKEDREEIVQIIKATMDTGCMCGLSSDTRSEMGHFFGRVKDLGEGNLSVGIETFSKAVQCMVTVRGWGEKIGGKVALVVFTTLTVGSLTLFGLGVRAFIQGVSKKTGGP
jgi:hypothetical protein